MNYIENQEFLGVRIQIVYNRERIWIKILAKKSMLQGIYKQGLLENLKKYFKFSEVFVSSKELRSSKTKIWERGMGFVSICKVAKKKYRIVSKIKISNLKINYVLL